MQTCALRVLATTPLAGVQKLIILVMLGYKHTFEISPGTCWHLSVCLWLALSLQQHLTLTIRWHHDCMSLPGLFHAR